MFGHQLRHCSAERGPAVNVQALWTRRATSLGRSLIPVRILRIALAVSGFIVLTGAFSAATVTRHAAATTRACATFEFIGVAGSGELQAGSVARRTLWMGTTINGLFSKVSDRYRNSKTTFTPYGVRYAAIPVDTNPIHVDVYLRDYEQSVQ